MAYIDKEKNCECLDRISYGFNDGGRGQYEFFPLGCAIDLWSHAARNADELAMSPFASAAVDILNATGYAARLNEVGHIAVKLS